MPGILHAATATPGARAADDDRALGAPVEHRVGRVARLVGVVDRLGRVRAEVDRLVAGRLERLQHDRLQREARMVEGAGDPHRRRLLSRAARSGPAPTPARRPSPRRARRPAARGARAGSWSARPRPAPCGGAPCARPGTSSRSPASETPPPITTSSGSNDVDRVRDADAEPLAEHAQHVLAVDVALARALDRVVPGDLVARGQPPAEERLRVRAGRLEREPVERAARRERLERAGLRERARVGRRAVGEVEPDHRVARARPRSSRRGRACRRARGRRRRRCRS